MKKAHITLGADPEFELVVGGEVVNASRVLREDVRLPWGDIGIEGSAQGQAQGQGGGRAVRPPAVSLGGGEGAW